MITGSRITADNYEAEGLLFMYSRARNPDGTIGYTVKPHDQTEWADWQDYFISMGMDRKASLMRTMAVNGFMVPAKHPTQFDAAYRRTRAAKPRDRMPSEMTLEEREQIAERLRYLPVLRQSREIAA